MSEHVDLIGEYELLELIAHGGMGSIYRARHRLMKRIVAIKVERITSVNRAELSKMFRREIEAAARVSHPNVLTVFDAGINRDHPYLVTEYVNGVDLYAQVRRSGVCTIAKAIDYSIQAADGLKAIHDCGIIHRDVKPSNILLNGQDHVKIIDFGICKFQKAPVHEKRSTRNDEGPTSEPQRLVPKTHNEDATARSERGRPGLSHNSRPSVWSRLARLFAHPDSNSLSSTQGLKEGSSSLADETSILGLATKPDDPRPHYDGRINQDNHTVTFTRLAIERSFVSDVLDSLALGSMLGPLPRAATKPKMLGTATESLAHGEGVDIETEDTPDSDMTLAGTLAFMSPEQLRNFSRVDARTDIYALGCTLFYLLTGKSIVDGHVSEIIKKKIAGDTRIPSDLRDDIPPRLDDIVRKMTMVEAADRYESMTQVREALEVVGEQPRVFISYRREDSLDATDRLYTSLLRHFDQESLFLDVHSIPAGADFRQHIEASVLDCDVMLAIIGDHWLPSRNDDGRRRIDDPSDFVRIEIHAAIDNALPIIPVLVGNARMPKPRDLPGDIDSLSRRNAAEVRAGRNYDGQIDRLTKEIRELWRNCRA